MAIFWSCSYQFFTKIYINYDKKRHSVHFRDKIIFRNKEKELFSRKSNMQNKSR